MDQVDDFYFSVVYDSDVLFPISDEKYAYELQLQEVLISSVIATKKIKTEQPETSERKIKIEPGQSSGIKSEESLLCKICMESKPTTTEIFSNLNCSHSFCADCISQYIGSKIGENISAVKCPEEGCKGLIEPENCQGFMPKPVFERWGSALCEAMVLSFSKFTYCPFKDCSELLLVDEEGKVIDQCECPSCRRMFCVKCEAAWHSGLSCEEFQRLGVDERGREDLKLFEVAKSKKWKRCPKCRFYVEKTQGCLHVICRCNFQFCYECGKQWSDTHASCNSD